MQRSSVIQSLASPLVLSLVLGAAGPANAGGDDRIDFEMVRNGAAVSTGCLPDAKADVRIRSLGPVEVMDVAVKGLPPETEFDLFVIQVPNLPFGQSWYQGDIETNRYGRGHQRFIGRFNKETFIVAPGAAPAPVVHSSPIPDAATNPQSGPVHTYHLGLWFNSPEDAKKAGCLDVVTPFNGEHNAGVQLLNTSNFPDLEGPLLKLEP